MNRKVKYRAWDKENERMIEWNEEFFSDMSPVTNWGNSIDYDNMELMEYIGLKDKNGVEICEGDLILDHVGHGVVEYKDGAYRVNYKDSTCKWFLDYLKSEKSSVEVIGNIYENK